METKVLDGVENAKIRAKNLFKYLQHIFQFTETVKEHIVC